MSRRPTPHARLAGLAALLLLVGCSVLEPRPDRSQFYVLNAVAPASDATSALSIGLGPVSLPHYLDRPEIARRVDENEIAYDPMRRWAEPLAPNFERVVAANLVQLLGPRRIELFPWYRTQEFDYVVTVAASRFELQPDGTVLLAVRWTLLDKSDSSRDVRLDTYTRPVANPDQVAAALSDLTAELSQAIAAAIRTEHALR